MATPTVPLTPLWSAGVSATPFARAADGHRFGFNARRSSVVSRHGSVACSQPLAAQVGLRLLESGCNAAEACIGVAAALAVLEPCSTGLGGDCFAIYFDAATGAVEGLNASGRSPAALSQDKLKPHDRNRAGDALHPLSVHCVTVPGAARGWEDALKKWGSGQKSMQQLLQPAIDMAEEGVPIAPLTAESWARSEALLLRQNNLPCPLLPNGRAPAAGALYRNADLGASLRVLASAGGADEFYSGRIGQSIVSCVQSRGGLLQLSDLTSHRSSFPTPVSVRFHGVDVFEIPPNGQGITALLALNILNEMEKQAEAATVKKSNVTTSTGSQAAASATASSAASASNAPAVASLASLGHNSSAYLHRVIEAMRLAFADTRYFVCDTEHADADRPLQPHKSHQQGAAAGGAAAAAAAASAKQSLSSLLSPAYAAARSGLIDPSRTRLDHPWGCPTSYSSTVSFVAVDAQGNACSFINSNYMGFGTAIVAPGTGFTLQNRGAGFTLDPPAQKQQQSGMSQAAAAADAAAAEDAAATERPADPSDGPSAQMAQQQQDLHANGLAGGKLPYHTIIPGLATKDGKLWAPFSVMGGFNQPQGHVQLLLNILVNGMDPQAAVDAPRFCIDSGTAGGTVLLEDGISEDTVQALAQLGHPVQLVSGYERMVFGRAQIIRRMDDGTLWAGSDGRADGCAVGY